MFIDSHAHIYFEYYTDISNVIKKAKDNKVNYIINNGINHDTNIEVLKTAGIYNEMYATLGIHPECANDYSEKDLDFIINNLSNNKVLAIGEIGLDYHYEGYDKLKQIDLFKKQLDIAQKYNVPVVVHSRKATQDTLDILKKYNLKGIIHSFSGSEEVAKQYISMGYKLGINGVVTFKNAHIKDVIKSLGIKHFVLETDSPYLSPDPFRGKTNSPSNIPIIANFLSQYLECSIMEISKITNENIKSIFDKIDI